MIPILSVKKTVSAVILLAVQAAGISLVIATGACVGDDPGSANDDAPNGGTAGGHVCIYTESSSYQCVDSHGDNPTVDTCSDKYKSLDDCQAQNKSAQEKSGEGADMCLYKRTVSNFRWLPGTCASNTGSNGGTSGSSTSSSSGSPSIDGGGSSSSSSSSSGGVMPDAAP